MKGLGRMALEGWGMVMNGRVCGLACYDLRAPTEHPFRRGFHKLDPTSRPRSRSQELHEHPGCILDSSGPAKKKAGRTPMYTWPQQHMPDVWQSQSEKGGLI